MSHACLSRYSWSRPLLFSKLAMLNGMQKMHVLVDHDSIVIMSEEANLVLNPLAIFANSCKSLKVLETFCVHRFE